MHCALVKIAVYIAIIKNNVKLGTNCSKIEQCIKNEQCPKDSQYYYRKCAEIGRYAYILS